MKISLAQLHAQPLYPIYLVSGDDSYLSNEAVRAICAYARQQEFSDVLRFTHSQHFAWQEVLDAQQAYSLFAPKQIILLQIGNGKIGDPGSKAVQALCDNAHSDCCIILHAEKLEAASKRSRWYKSVDAIGATLAVQTPQGHALVQWIKQSAQQLSLALSNEAAQQLAEHSAGNCFAARQCLDKLALTHAQQTIDVASLQGVLQDGSRYDIFQLIDSCMQRQAGRAAHMLRYLEQAGEPAAIVLWVFIRQLRTLANLSDKLSKGGNFAQACRELGIWQSQQGACRKALQGRDTTFFYDLLTQAQNVDKSIKGLLPSDPWLDLQQLSSELAT